MNDKININDLPKDLQKRIKLENDIPTGTRVQNLTINDIRGFAIGVLAVIKHLTPAERDRVLSQAIKLNQI